MRKIAIHGATQFGHGTVIVLKTIIDATLLDD